MATLSKEAARELIRTIREDNGGITPADRAASAPAVLRSLENLRRKLGSVTKRLANDLYSKETRFLYELIQNAEDNTYTKAEKQENDIYLRFSLYPDRLVLDSNEDGFCENHVRAICSTAESTKTVSQGFIGEKGIGFKSVFTVATKVHIQSGPFSFSFEHGTDSSDDGLGMVTPYEEDYHRLPKDVNTRITLTLQDPSSFSQRADELRGLPNTLLLFLTKLQVLHINIYPQTEQATEIKFIHTTGNENQLRKITKTAITDGKLDNHELHYYVIRRDATDLSPDEARKHTNEATVVLAFPVEEDKTPIIKKQLVYAFLPLRNAGFTFLIQSDFLTQVSREDVTHCRRNKDLLLETAKAFRDAVVHFCQDPILRYQWMRYLPDDSIHDDFWIGLQTHIVSLLKKSPILLPWSETTPRLPSKVYYVRSLAKDKHGQPLFADLEEEGYLSPKYTSDDIKRLNPLGLRVMPWDQVIDRICFDLATKSPRMWVNDPIDEDWQKRVAKLLSTGLSKNIDRICKRIKSLRLIPLQSITPVSANANLPTLWVSVENRNIFFPTTKKIPIPSDLGLNLVEQAAVSNIDRKTLFSKLGVIEARPGYIVSLIIERYTKSTICTIYQSIAHLQYLYWNLPQDEPDLKRTVYLFDKEGQAVFCIQSHKEHMYFEEEKEEWQQLLEEAKPLDLNVHFLHPKYLDSVPNTASRHGRSWTQWLSEIAGVKNHLQLLNPKGNALSEEFKYIMDHRPENLVGLLRRFWSFYEPKVPSVLETIRASRVPSDENLADNLQSTFLPLPRLKDLALELRIAHFPFLLMPDELADEDEKDWQFLTIFGVRSSDDLHFYVNALKRLAFENQSGCESNVLDALFKIYDALGQKCSNSADSKFICNLFENEKMIYIPSESTRAAQWVNSRDCVWTGPKWLRAKLSLNGTSRFSSCNQLFHIILRIPDAGCKEYLEDLEAMKLKTGVHVADVAVIYRCLLREAKDDSSLELIRSSFRSSKLVFVPSKSTWVTLSSCIWAENETQILGKDPLKTAYSELEPFFHDLLRVPKPDIRMHVQGLIKRVGDQAQPSDMDLKALIMVISSLNPVASDVAELLGANIFVVITKVGQKTRTNSANGFAIVDRLEYGAAFRGKISMLDYTIEEVNACKPLFLSLGMGKKYLSELVDEKTSVDAGVLSTHLTESFRMKAYAFVRCTVHYLGTKRKADKISLYEKLGNASIYVSSGIVKSMSVDEDGHTITVEKSRANFHLEEDDEGLRLYVPQDESSRQVCMNRQLPKRMATFLHICNADAQLVITGIINCGTLGAVNGVLEDAGIVEVDGMVPSPDTAQKMYSTGNGSISSEDSTPATETDSNTMTPSSSSYDGQSNTTSAAWTALTTSFGELSVGVPRRHHTFFGQNTGHIDSLSSPPSNQSLPVRPSPAEWVRQERLDFTTPVLKYDQLLNRMIESAGRIIIPAKGSRSVDTAPGLMSTGYTPYVSLFGGRSMEGDRMIGAAGELLVFEILKHLNLPRFSEENWKSTIRKEVRVHNKYKNLEPWKGRETTDITYKDSEGFFTKQLIEKGYLEGDKWEGKQPEYFFEVKTTRKTYDEKFYMSGSQYNRMKGMKLQPERTAESIYVIFRVFDLEGRPGLVVYVDPMSSRLEGKLEFTVNTWEVQHIERV